MAKKTKRISINKLEAAVKDCLGEVRTVDWRGLEIEIRRTIPFSVVMVIVDGVANACFDDGKFVPERMDYVLRSCIVQFYTNLSMPSNAEKQYAILYSTDLYDVVLQYINPEQYYSIVDAVKNQIDYLRQTNVRDVQNKVQEVMKAMSGLMSAIGEIMSDVTSDDVAKLVEAIGDGQLDEAKLMQAFLDQKYQTDKE